MTDFNSFASYFPEISPPLTLTDESIDYINATNDPLPLALLHDFILKWEGIEETDEFTEFLPCLKFSPYKDIQAFVYWKAALLRYEFIMVTTDEKGNAIARKPICGTIVEGDLIKKSVARIDEENIIHIAAGANLANEPFLAQQSQSFAMEIMANGEIAFLSGD
ncbi:MAG: hypothetical protein IPN29_21875 [Saprospiraceae bacterium]|nr:hypothetical protein [Saprospiraceae bacterium]